MQNLFEFPAKVIKAIVMPIFQILLKRIHWYWQLNVVMGYSLGYFREESRLNVGLSYTFWEGPRKFWFNPSLAQCQQIHNTNMCPGWEYACTINMLLYFYVKAFRTVPLG